MRQIGILESEKDAKRFVDYLITQGVSAIAETDSGTQWSIWVREEDRVDETRNELSQFRANPHDPRYSGVEREAASVRHQQEARARQIRKQSVDMRSRWEGPLTRRAPATVLLIAISVIVFLLSGFGASPQGTIYDALTFSDLTPPLEASPEARSPWYSIARGEVWRLVTPIFIHYGILHLAFNMFVLHAFGSAIEPREGTAAFGLGVLAIAIFSNVLQVVLGPSAAFGGMSGVDYGLFGYAWFRARTDPRSGYFVSRELVLLMIFWMLLGFFGAFSSMNIQMANWAHLGGLVAGVALALLKAPRQ